MVTQRIKDTGKQAARKVGRKVGDYARERPAITASLAMHTLLILFLVVGMPLFWEKAKPLPPRTVNIDILPVRDKTNVKPEEEAPKPEEKKEEEKPKPVKTAPPEPEQPKPEPKPAPKPKEQKPVAKPKPKPKPPKEKPKPEETWDDMMKGLLKDQAKKASSKPEKQKQDAEYNDNEELSISQQDAINSAMQKQIEDHWEIPAGARDAAGMQVELKFKLKPDGSVYDVQIVDQMRYATDQVFRASADSAVRAAYEASPLKNLPPKYYDYWKDNKIIFDPSDMF